MFDPEIKFIGEPPEDPKAYLKMVYTLVADVIEGDPGEDGEMADSMEIE